MVSERGMIQFNNFIDLGINYKLNHNAQQRLQQYGSETLMIFNNEHEPAVAVANISLSKPEPTSTSSE